MGADPLSHINAGVRYQASDFNTVESALMGAGCFTTAQRPNQAIVLPEKVS
jgi:hypothetical protein